MPRYPLYELLNTAIKLIYHPDDPRYNSSDWVLIVSKLEKELRQRDFIMCGITHPQLDLESLSG